MVNKTILILIAIIIGLILFCVIVLQKMEMKNQKIAVIEQSLSEREQTICILNSDIDGYNKARIRANEEINKLREKAKNDKTDCNCYNTVMPDYVIDRLRNRNSKTNKN